MDNKHWTTIKGWFSYKSLYEEIINLIPEDEIMVELGTWLGQSTCFMGQKIKESGKNVKFYACDLFIIPDENYLESGESGLTEWEKRCDEQDFLPIFLDNLKKQGVEDWVTPIKMDTFEFSKTFEDKSIFFLFVDDNHDPIHVYNELNAWLPKMKDNSILSGHDSDSKHIIKALNKFVKEHNLTYTINKPDKTWTIKLNKEGENDE